MSKKYPPTSLLAAFLSLLITGLLALPVLAEDYLSQEDFLGHVFGTSAPKPSTLWLSKEQKQEALTILGHPYQGMRIRYWINGQTSAWILEEIGKERPIRIGVSVNSGKIERVDILAFRESRGWEVKFPFFTDQFKGAALAQSASLDRNIDGITGATLSVRAVTNVARLALYLAQQTAPGTQVADSGD